MRKLSNPAFRLWTVLQVFAAGKFQTDVQIGRLAAVLGWSERYVREAARELEHAGLVARAINAGWGTPGHKSNIWKLNRCLGGTPCSATQDSSQDPSQNSSHSGYGQPIQAAERLVKDWLLERKINRTPFQTEVAYAKKVLATYATTDEAYSAVAEAMGLLQRRNLLQKTLTFNSLKLIFGDL